jgi:Heparinase II/III-like protein/Heparinase II/III N-terminus
MPRIRRVKGKLARLAKMTGAELRSRTRQEFSKRWDRAIYRLGLRPHRRDIALDSDEAPRFFFAPEQVPEILAQLRDCFPQFEGETVARAERICRHRFDLLGYEGLDYGAEIDWQLDRVSGHSAPRKPWHKIRYLDFKEVGDSKVTWELNRHHHWVILAKAYRLTGDARYTVELQSQWRHWQQRNSYPIGINWASSLEVAFRSLSWLWVLRLLEGTGALREPFHEEIIEALALNGRHIERYLSTYFSPNTHLLGEGAALFSLGVLCPQLPRARLWRECGWEIVLVGADNQVGTDGMHFEHSTYYHVYALDFFLHVRVLAERNGITIPEKLDRVIERMLDALAILGQAGRPPRIGDDDGGRLFDPRRNRGEHLLDPLATGAVLYARPDLKALVGGPREETFWLLGPRAAEELDKIPDMRLAVRSEGLADTGIYVLASFESRPTELTIDAGGVDALAAGHRHASLLSIHLAAGGREYLLDPGTFVYCSAGNDRNEFRATAAHNTVLVDRCEQAEPVGPFTWRSWPTTKVDRWIEGESFDLFSGYHTAYTHLAGHPIHRRSVFHLKSHFWLVRDTIEGESVHELDLLWHFAPGRVRMSGSGAAVLESEDGFPFAVVPGESNKWVNELVEGEWSPAYGIRRPAPVLRVSLRAQLPQEFSTVLLVGGPAVEPGRLAPLEIAGAHAVGVSAWRYETRHEEHLMFFSSERRPWQVGAWSSDAEFVYAGLDEARRLRRLVMCHGRSVECAGQVLITAAHSVDWADWGLQDGIWRLAGPEREAIIAEPPICAPGPLFHSEAAPGKGRS